MLRQVENSSMMADRGWMKIVPWGQIMVLKQVEISSMVAATGVEAG